LLIKNSLIIILGPTASGKTNVATHLANQIDGEIISADSRQVYRKMDIGTGKDLNEYVIDGKQIPYHLIDSCDAGSKYILPDFQRDFRTAFEDITKRGKTPILCGGTGLYLEAILENHQYTAVPEDAIFRKSTENKNHHELLNEFKKLNQPENFTPDLSTRKRTIRAIEVCSFLNKNDIEVQPPLAFTPIIIGLAISRELRREKITKRLHERLQNGMIEEVQSLLDSGISTEELIYYGLEYKFITEYLTGKLNLEEMTEKLEIGIHQFAKRQMTWFRRMEKKGHHIHWIEAELSLEDKINLIQKQL
jgi:tRNA dimethylallyltransferase